MLTTRPPTRGMDLIGGQVFLLFCLLFWLYRAACGILIPDQGLNPHPLHWKHGVLATGLARAVPRAGISVRSFQTAIVPSCKTEGLGASGVLLWKGAEPWTSRPGTSWLSHDSLSVGLFADCLTCPGTPVPVWRLTGAQESSPLSALSLGEVKRAAQRGHPLPACALAWPPLCSKPEVKSTTEDSEEVTPGQSHPNMSALLP